MSLRLHCSKITGQKFVRGQMTGTAGGKQDLAACSAPYHSCWHQPLWSSHVSCQHAQPPLLANMNTEMCSWGKSKRKTTLLEIEQMSDLGQWAHKLRNEFPGRRGNHTKSRRQDTPSGYVLNEGVKRGSQNYSTGGQPRQQEDNWVSKAALYRERKWKSKYSFWEFVINF